ncbi:hypothetical protein POVWA2_061400 [Plasmodium ovale wallikeri]|uniref:Uncharacterized protein n=1 Tax=Plasmodium ovale wallikeri TaxID=864142 RepID=A0A1A9A3E4_PLAOA|nr:hypothetical protein POVWA1_061840 [Plasmodium ovale wallikeri]SBT50971.1 hypothetical protein POVWA2_061400 [Plasmodium ovale wallikeri]
MGKGREVFTFEEKCNLSKKTKSTNFGSHTSSDRENSEIAFDSNSDILKYDNHRKNNNNKVYSYSKRFITILSNTTLYALKFNCFFYMWQSLCVSYICTYSVRLGIVFLNEYPPMLSIIDKHDPYVFVHLCLLFTEFIRYGISSYSFRVT